VGGIEGSLGGEVLRGTADGSKRPRPASGGGMGSQWKGGCKGYGKGYPSANSVPIGARGPNVPGFPGAAPNGTQAPAVKMNAFLTRPKPMGTPARPLAEAGDAVEESDAKRQRIGPGPDQWSDPNASENANSRGSWSNNDSWDQGDGIDSWGTKPSSDSWQQEENSNGGAVAASDGGNATADPEAPPNHDSWETPNVPQNESWSSPAPGVGPQQGPPRPPPPPPPPAAAADRPVAGETGAMSKTMAQGNHQPPRPAQAMVRMMGPPPQQLPPHMLQPPQHHLGLPPGMSHILAQQAVNMLAPGQQLMPGQQLIPGQLMPAQQALPAVPISLAAATKDIVPVSSKKGGAGQQDEKGKQIAMQFLNADRATQQLMLKDPNVAVSILKFLGEIKGARSAAPAGAPGVAAAVGTAPAVAADPAAAGATGPAPGSTPALPAPASPPGAKPAGPPAVPWSGQMKLTRSLGKPLGTQATLLHGKVQLVELALRTAASNGGVLNISHRVPFDDLARRMPGAVLAFVPQGPHEQPMYAEYCRYFGSKVRAGVAQLDGVDALYIVPPVEEASAMLNSLSSAGGAPPLPKQYLLGVIAATPGPTTGVTGGQAVQAAKASAAKPAKTDSAGSAPATAPAVAPAPAAPAAGAKAALPTKKELDTSAPASDGSLAPGVESTAPEGGATEPPESKPDGEDGEPEMSGEALMNLFSNPDLLSSLQGGDEPADGGDD